jgi:pyruvate decarboxylase
LDIIYKAKRPVILADACAIRHGVGPETHELMAKLNIPSFVAPMGKGAIDETNPNYGGVYIGDISLPNVKDAVERSDCILSIGALLSDFNTVLFTWEAHLTYRVLLVTIVGKIGPSNYIPHGLWCDTPTTLASA